MTGQLLLDWSSFVCKVPLNVWLLVSYAYLTLTHLLGVLSKYYPTDLVEMASICVYFFVLLPFSMVWTLLGTIWYSQADLACLPLYLRGTGVLLMLGLSYLYVVVGLALVVMFSLMFFVRAQTFSELSIILVLNDDHRVDSLSQSLLESLGRHAFTVDRPDLSCPICFDDITVRSM
jgi:hypothetical protein